MALGRAATPSWAHERTDDTYPPDPQAGAQPLGSHDRRRERRAGPLLRDPPRSLPRRLRRPHPPRWGRPSHLRRRRARHPRRRQRGLGRDGGAPQPARSSVAPDRARPARGRGRDPPLPRHAVARRRRVVAVPDRRWRDPLADSSPVVGRPDGRGGAGHDGRGSDPEAAAAPRAPRLRLARDRPGLPRRAPRDRRRDLRGGVRRPPRAAGSASRATSSTAPRSAAGRVPARDRLGRARSQRDAVPARRDAMSRRGSTSATCGSSSRPASRSAATRRLARDTSTCSDGKTTGGTPTSTSPAPAIGSSTWRPMSGRGRCASSAPYDDARWRSAPSRPARTSE